MRLIFTILLGLAAMATFAVRDKADYTYFKEPGEWPRFENPHVGRIDLTPGLVRSGGMPDLGGLKLAGAWQLTSSDRGFGNFSALGQFADGRFISVGDRNTFMIFPAPDAPGPWEPVLGRPFHTEIPDIRMQADSESLIVDPQTQQVLVGYENALNLLWMTPAMRPVGMIAVPALREWPENQGPEAMARLADGRLVIMGEVYAHKFNRRLHPGLVFAGMPQSFEKPGRFELAMPEGYRPTDLAQLPDGRLLVLGRKFTIAGFRSVILTADPAQLRAGAVLSTHEIARIDDPRIRDNYEGMAVTREADGSVSIWLISDSNLMVALQRTLVLKLRFR